MGWGFGTLRWAAYGAIVATALAVAGGVVSRRNRQGRDFASAIIAILIGAATFGLPAMMLIGAEQLRMMKASAILVNTSRGPVVDEAALAEALERKTIAGAGLDVFEQEPKVQPLLLKLENVVLAPHIASASIDTRRKMSVMAAENALAALAGRRPPNLLNPS